MDHDFRVIGGRANSRHGRLSLGHVGADGGLAPDIPPPTANVNFVGGNDDWFSAAAWDDGAAPGSGSNVTIAAAGQVYMASGDAEAYANTVTLGSTGSTLLLDPYQESYGGDTLSITGGLADNAGLVDLVSASWWYDQYNSYYHDYQYYWSFNSSQMVVGGPLSVGAAGRLYDYGASLSFGATSGSVSTNAGAIFLGGEVLSVYTGYGYDYALDYGSASTSGTLLNSGVIALSYGSNNYYTAGASLGALALQNSGQVTVSADCSVNAQSLQNLAGGTITLYEDVYGSGILYSNGFSNAGTVIADYITTISVSGILTNSGVIDEYGGYIADSTGFSITSTGTLYGYGTLDNAVTDSGVMSTTGFSLLGTLTVTNGGEVFGGPLYLGTSGAIDIAGSGTLSSVSTAGTVTVGANTVLDLVGSDSLACIALAGNGATLSVADGASLSAITISDLGYSGTAVDFSDTGSLSAGTLNIGGNGGSFALLALSDDTGNGATLTLGSQYVVDATGNATLILNNTNDALANQGLIEASAGTLLIGNGNGAFTNAGALTLAASEQATIEVAGFANSGLVSVAGGASLDIVGGGTLGGTLGGTVTGGGTLRLDGGTYSASGSNFSVTTLVVDAGGMLAETGTLAVGAGQSVTTLDLLGTISGGTFSDAGGGLVFAGGTLSGVTTQGTLSVQNATGNFTGVTVAGAVNVGNSGTLNVRGGLGGSAGGTIHLSGSNAVANLFDTQTLNNATLDFGGATGYTVLNLAVDDGGPDTLTLGPNFALTQTGNFAEIQLDPRLSTAANIFDNQGTLTAGLNGGNVEIIGGYSTFLNQGSLIVNNGGAVSVFSTFTNTGSITLSTGNLYLYGTITDGGFGYFRTYNGSAIDMDGTLQNAGQVITVGAAAEILLAGFVIGGEITDAGGGLTIDGAVLVGVDYNGTLNLGTNTNLTIDSGLNVGGPTGTLDLSGATSLYFDDTETVGNATIAIGNNSIYNTIVLGTVYGDGNGSQTLTLSSQAAITQTGTFAEILLDQAGSGNALVNQGTITVAAAGAVLEIYGPYAADYFANQGSLIVSNGAQVDLAANVEGLGNFSTAGGGTVALVNGATLDNAGGTLSLGGTAQLTLNGGTIEGGTVRDSGGGLLLGGQGGTLSGVTYRGALTLAGDYETLAVTGGLNVGAGFVEGYFTISGNGAALDFLGSQSVANTTFDLGSDSGTAFMNLEGLNGQAATLTLGANLLQTGNGADIDYDPAGLGNSLVIDSQITAGLAGATLSIVGEYAGDILSLGANGFLFAYDGGTLDLSQAGTLANAAGGTLTGGAVIADQYSTILLNNDVDITTLATTMGLNGYDADIEWYDSIAGTETTLDQSLAAITGTGSLQVVNQDFAAANAFADDGTLTLIAANFSDAGGLAIGAGGWLEAGADYATTTISAYLNEAGTFSIYEGTVDLTGGGVLSGVVDIDGGGGALLLDSASYQLIGGVVTAFGGGTLNVEQGASLVGFGTVTGWSGVPVTLVDSGEIEASGGTLTLDASMSGDGVLVADVGAVLDLVGGFSLTQAISGAGLLQLDSGTFTLPSYVSIGTVAVDAGATLSSTLYTSIESTLAVGGTVIDGDGMTVSDGIAFVGGGGVIEVLGGYTGLSLIGGAGGAGSLDVTGPNASLSLISTQTLQGGTLNVGNSNAQDFVSEDDGTLTLASDYTVNLAGAATYFNLAFASDELVNQGTIDVGYGLANLGDGLGTILNQGTIAISNGAQLNVDAGLFDNTGLLSLTSGALVFEGTLTSSNLGSIAIGGGLIDFDGLLENTGTLAIGAGTALGTIGLYGEISGGTISDAGNGLNGAQGILANVTYEGALAVNGDLTLQGSDDFTGADGTGAGTITIANPGYLILEGTITGTATINIGGPPNSDYGESEFILADAGELAAASFNLDGSAFLIVEDSHRLDNGTLSIGAGTGSTVEISDDTGNGATLTLGSQFAVDVSGGTEFYFYDSNDALINQGSIAIGSGGLKIGTNPDDAFFNEGSIVVGDGTYLQVATGSFVNSGTITLNGSGYLATASALSGNGTIDLAGAGSALYLGGGGSLAQTIYGAGTLHLQGASFTLAGQSLAVAHVAVDAGATLNGHGSVAGALADTGSVYASGGTLSLTGVLSGAGTLAAASGAVLDLLGGGSFAGTLAGAGRVEIDAALTLSGAAALDAATIVDTATITLAANTSLTEAAASVFDITAAKAKTKVTVGGAASSQFANSGSLMENGPGTVNVSVAFINSGNVTAGSGTLAFLGAVTNDGTMSASAGVLSIKTDVGGAGTLEMGAGGTLSLLKGAAAGQTVDFLAGTGLLDLTQATKFNATIDGFGAGDRIDLLNTPETSFSFAKGVLTVKDGTTKEASLHFGGGYTLADFGLASDGHGGTIITFK